MDTSTEPSTFLGQCSIDSPIQLSRLSDDSLADYVKDDQAIRNKIDVLFSEKDNPEVYASKEPFAFQRAGPREKIYFMPAHTHAAIVTCGGLCPGINDVIRALVRCLWLRYGVRRITGIRYGYNGFFPENGYPVIELDPDLVDEIHSIGGTFLGSSRGGGNRTGEIVDAIERLNVNILFAIGGDGTQKGAFAIANEISRRMLKIAVVGIPKSIDNDLMYIDKTFGFDTAVAHASYAVNSAHVEAKAAHNGLGLVKVMGRESGFIAVHTVLAAHEANFVLIPEVAFDLEGENGFLRHLEHRIRARAHAVVVVAEGAGQRYLGDPTETDASGNIKLNDIGIYLRDRIISHFRDSDLSIPIKYIDPSYMIRSSKAIPSDSVYCERLGNNAVHAAMAGKTRILVAMVHGQFVHIPMAAAISQRSYVNPESALWRDAIEATRQPASMISH